LPQLEAIIDMKLENGKVNTIDSEAETTAHSSCTIDEQWRLRIRNFWVDIRFLTLFLLFIANWDFALVAAALLYCHPTICSHYLNGLKGRGPAASSTFLGEWLWKKSTFRGTSIKVETIFSDLSLSPNCLKWHAIDFKLILWII